MNDQLRDHDDETAVEEMRKILLPVEPLPLGVKSRWEAALQREARERQPGRLALGVLGAVAFIGACAIVGPEGFTGWAWTTFVGGGIVYSLSAKALISRDAPPSSHFSAAD
jgi:hypothetical protein